MTDINHIITLGIGEPGDIEHFILFGLNGSIVFTGLLGTDVRRRVEALDINRAVSTEVRGRLGTLRVEWDD